MTLLGWGAGRENSDGRNSTCKGPEAGENLTSQEATRKTEQLEQNSKRENNR